jgi:transcriptional repressor NrdR
MGPLHMVEGAHARSGMHPSARRLATRPASARHEPRLAEGIGPGLAFTPTSSSYTAVSPPQVVVGCPQVLPTGSTRWSTPDGFVGSVARLSCQWWVAPWRSQTSRGVDMHCPFCRHPDSRVIDSRASDDGSSIRRRRQCPDCGRRFTTVETASLTVVKRSGVTEPFSRAKVLSGVRKACQGRPVSDDDLAVLSQRVEETIRSSGTAEVEAHDVGLAILGPLRAGRDRLPEVRVRLPGLRVARGLRGRHHAAARRA